MRFSVIHPTARIKPPYPSFPRGWFDSYRAFLEKCANPQDVQYVLVVHAHDYVACLRSFGGFMAKEWKEWGDFRFVINRGPNTYVAQVNAGAAAATGDIFIVTMDDLFPPQNWDTLISERLGDISSEKVLHVSTGSPTDRELMTVTILTSNRVHGSETCFFPATSRCIATTI